MLRDWTLDQNKNTKLYSESLQPSHGKCCLPIFENIKCPQGASSAPQYCLHNVLNLYVYVPAWVSCVLCACWYPGRPEEGVRFSGTGVVGRLWAPGTEPWFYTRVANVLHWAISPMISLPLYQYYFQNHWVRDFTEHGWNRTGKNLLEFRSSVYLSFASSCAERALFSTQTLAPWSGQELLLIPWANREPCLLVYTTGWNHEHN